VYNNESKAFNSYHISTRGGYRGRVRSRGGFHHRGRSINYERNNINYNNNYQHHNHDRHNNDNHHVNHNNHHLKYNPSHRGRFRGRNNNLPNQHRPINNNMNNIRCYTCHKLGHTSNYCRLKKRQYNRDDNNNTNNDNDGFINLILSS
jgi:hypothetical protein